MKPNKLLVKNTRKEAEKAIEALGLDSEEWMGIGICETLCGYGFDKIVVDVNTTGMPRTKYRKFHDWYHRTLRTRLSNPNDKNIINI